MCILFLAEVNKAILFYSFYVDVIYNYYIDKSIQFTVSLILTIKN